MALLVISLAALAIGPLLYRFADRARWTLAALDGFVLVSVTGLVLVHLIPDAVEAAGVGAIALTLLGFIGPVIAEHTLHRAAHQAHIATLVLAMVGLGIHAFFDGVGLATPLHDAHTGDASVLAIAVTLHQLPVAITIWALLQPVIGGRRTALVLLFHGTATLLGFALGDTAASAADARWMALVQSLITGSLLHVVLHRPAPSAAPKGTPENNVASGIGALLGVAAVAALSDTHFPQSVAHAAGFGRTFLNLALESAPAFLVAFALAGVVQVVLPQASVRWMRTGSAVTESVRGVGFGLPLPICSCGVIDLYRALIAQGAPVAAALAFLVATPELGIDAILISLPLLGAELTVLRVAVAALAAVGVGWVIGRRLPPREADPETPAPLPLATTRDRLARLRAGLRFGFVDIVDHVGPWLIFGTAIGAVVEPLLPAEWVAALPPGIDVLLFALLGLPTYVSASGATPLVAVLIHKGVSPGAAIAFLLVGPATNMTTFGVLRELHGRRTALAFTAALTGLAIAIGLAVNAVLPTALHGLADLSAEAEHGWIEWLSLAALAVLFALSILRQGPRGFVAQVIRPYGSDDGHDHAHGHGHGHGHSH